jgi:hypothetical protein
LSRAVMVESRHKMPPMAAVFSRYIYRWPAKASFEFTQTDRCALSSSTGRLTVLRKQGSRNVTVLVDSRFRGNDRLCYVIIIEQFAIIIDSKMVSLRNL